MIIFPHFPSLILSLNKPSVWSQPGHLSAYGSPHSLWHIRASLDPPENITINTQQMMGRDQRGHREISQLIKISDRDLVQGTAARQLRVRCKMYDVPCNEGGGGGGGGGGMSRVSWLNLSIVLFFLASPWIFNTGRRHSDTWANTMCCSAIIVFSLQFSLWENHPRYGIILHNLQLF